MRFAPVPFSRLGLCGFNMWGLSFLAMASTALAEEKNGLQLTVSKKTIERSDDRGNYYYSDRIDRTQGLKAVVKNISFKEKPEGELEWTILVRKYYSTTVEKHSGTEKLKALRAAESAEFQLGSAQVYGWRSASYNVKDKLEYQVIVTHGGSETIRVSSTSAFDSLAKRAIKVSTPAE
jgi:hypothetical protein